MGYLPGLSKQIFPYGTRKKNYLETLTHGLIPAHLSITSWITIAQFTYLILHTLKLDGHRSNRNIALTFFLRYLELLSSISSFDDVARKLERVAGMKQSEFFLKFPNMTGNYAKRKKGDFYELTNRLKNDAYETLKAVTLGIRHTTLNNWRNISKIRYSDGTYVEQNRNRNSHSNAMVSPLSSILSKI